MNLLLICMRTAYQLHDTVRFAKRFRPDWMGRFEDRSTELEMHPNRWSSAEIRHLMFTSWIPKVFGTLEQSWRPSNPTFSPFWSQHYPKVDARDCLNSSASEGLLTKKVCNLETANRKIRERRWWSQETLRDPVLLKLSRSWMPVLPHQCSDPQDPWGMPLSSHSFVKHTTNTRFKHQMSDEVASNRGTS